MLFTKKGRDVCVLGEGCMCDSQIYSYVGHLFVNIELKILILFFVISWTCY